MAGPTSASADEPAPVPAPRLRASSDLDGLYVWLGPAGAAARVEGRWLSSWGGSLQVVRVRERAPVGVAGAWLSASHYAGRDGGRIALEGVIGTRRLLGPMLGVGAGPVIELGDLHHPRPGFEASAWIFAGITPYVRVGWVAETGGLVELGAQLSLPVRRW